MIPSRLGFRSLLGLGVVLGALGVSQAAGIATATGPPTSAPSEAAGRAWDDSSRSLKFETYQDQKEGYRWRLKATNGQIIATSGQGYKDKRDCKNAIDRIKKDAATKLKFETFEDKAEAASLAAQGDQRPDHRQFRPGVQGQARLRARDRRDQEGGREGQGRREAK